MRIGVLIRVRNGAATLPQVLAALARQTRPVDRILAVDNRSSDTSADLLRAAGADIATWSEPYDAPRVLNHGCALLRGCDLVLVISAHTVITDDDAVQRMEAAFADPTVSAVSAAWDDDLFWGVRVDATTLRGLKFGSPYSNSLGMLRHSAWQTRPFRAWTGRSVMEDYVWALEEIRSGKAVVRLPIRFQYLRRGHSREVDHTRLVFALASRCHLPVVWLGLRATFLRWLRLTITRGDTAERQLLGERLHGRLTWRHLPKWEAEPLAGSR